MNFENLEVCLIDPVQVFLCDDLIHGSVGSDLSVLHGKDVVTIEGIVVDLVQNDDYGLVQVRRKLPDDPHQIDRMMDIKICGADATEPWTEAVLFNENGGECCCTDVDEEFFGEWQIEYNGNDYYVDVQRGV